MYVDTHMWIHAYGYLDLTFMLYMDKEIYVCCLIDEEKGDRRTGTRRREDGGGKTERGRRRCRV